MKKSVNGYYKFYNKAGLSCRIKSSGHIDGSEILIRFKHKDDLGWLYHAPKRKFRNCLDATNFILKNLENEGMIFKISPVSSTLSIKTEGDNNAK